MELLEGESLSALLRRERTLPPLVAATITSQILAGLAAAHAKTVIHRDLKPGNILLARNDDGSCQVKILDFGISKFFTDGTSAQDVTAHGAVIGTPRFMAPEQARGQTDLDGRVDIYATGVLLYRMVTGKLPFAAKSHEEIIQHILEGNPRRPREIKPEIPPELERVILRAMDPNRDERYQDARAFLIDLQQAMPDILGGTVQITAHTGFTNTPTPMSLGTGVQGAYLSPKTTGQHTKAESPHALRAQRKGRVASWAIPLLLVLGIGGTAAWYFGIRDPGGSGGAIGPTLSGPPLRLGITRYLTAEQLQVEHKALIAYLQRRLRRPVELKIHEDYVDLSAQLAHGKLELAALSSYAYVRAKRRWSGLRLIATHVTKGGTSYEGYILARADSKIDSLEDLKGKVFCYVGPTSTSGYLFPRAVFRARGIDPDKAFATRFAGDHPKALKALAVGECDGAAIFAGLYIEGEKHGVSPEKFRILASTARIPNDAYCVPPNLPEGLVRSLSEALLALKPSSPAARQVLGKQSRIIGFAKAKDSDWNSVRKIEKYLALDDPKSKDASVP
jgi:phosphate/phosphite/phosphonate ABC transporter binding protein